MKNKRFLTIFLVLAFMVSGLSSIQAQSISLSLGSDGVNLNLDHDFSDYGYYYCDGHHHHKHHKHHKKHKKYKKYKKHHKKEKYSRHHRHFHAKSGKMHRVDRRVSHRQGNHHKVVVKGHKSKSPFKRIRH